MTTNALQAEIPMEPMMAEASDTPQVGIDTLHIQTLTNRISCGSPGPWNMFASPSWMYCITESLLQATELTLVAQISIHLCSWWYKKQMNVTERKGDAAEGLYTKSKVDGFLPPSWRLFGLDQMKSNSFLNVWWQVQDILWLLCFRGNIGANTGMLCMKPLHLVYLVH